MRLSLLSDGYISDRMNDAGRMAQPPHPLPGAPHFAALCRGVVVLVTLLVPLGLTLLAQTAAPTSDAIIQGDSGATGSESLHINSRG